MARTSTPFEIGPRSSWIHSASPLQNLRIFYNSLFFVLFSKHDDASAKGASATQLSPSPSSFYFDSSFEDSVGVSSGCSDASGGWAILSEASLVVLLSKSLAFVIPHSSTFSLSSSLSRSSTSRSYKLSISLRLLILSASWWAWS